MKTRLTIVSIGPGDPALLNSATADALRAAGLLLLRTDHHPLVSWLGEQDIAWTSLDDAYEQCEDFDTLSAQIADRVWSLASGAKHPVYAVPDLRFRTAGCGFGHLRDD